MLPIIDYYLIDWKMKEVQIIETVARLHMPYCYPLKYVTRERERERERECVDTGLPDGIHILKPKIPIWVNLVGPFN
jgi:hypothetical protein